MLLPELITEQSCSFFILLPSAGNTYTSNHSQGVLQQKFKITSRIRWRSSSLGNSRVAPWCRICSWIPSIWWSCRIGPSSCWRVSSRKSRKGVLTRWWIDRLLSRWLKQKWAVLGWPLIPSTFKAGPASALSHARPCQVFGISKEQ